jgi:hypothetical protein
MADGTDDPREYRGGAHEPADAKGGWADNEGVVPREMIDDTGPEPSDPQALPDAVQGEVTGEGQTEHTLDKHQGDHAEAPADDSANTATWHTDPATTAGRTGQGKA